MDIELKGLMCNEIDLGSESEAVTELTIDKYDLDRSSGMIIGRFNYEIESRTKLVWIVEVDGVQIFEGGSNLPFDKSNGDYDTTVFKYPNSAKASKIGKHKVNITYGAIPNIVESSETKTEWDDVQDIGEAEFTITLVKNKNVE